MKTWTLRISEADRNIFDEIRAGFKVVETRAATEKYRGIKRGDKLRFVCGGKQVTREVRSVRIFRTINSLVNRVPFRKIMPSVNSEKELREVYCGYPNYREKIRKYGLIAMRI